jgi:hypothetical protein
MEVSLPQEDIVQIMLDEIDARNRESGRRNALNWKQSFKKGLAGDVGQSESIEYIDSPLRRHPPGKGRSGIRDWPVLMRCCQLGVERFHAI